MKITNQHTITSVLALMLALFMLMTGCGQDTKDSVSGSLAPSESEGLSIPSGTLSDKTKTSEPEPEAEPTPDAHENQESAADDSDTESADGQATSVSMGTLIGGTYTNSYTGFGFTLDENWTIYPADQLQSLPEDLSELLMEGTDFEGVELDMFTDVLAENVEDLTTINVLYQKLDMQARLLYLTMSEEEIIDTMLEETYDYMVSAYANAGIIVESMERTTISFLGEERAALRTVASQSDVPYYTLQIFDYDLGQYSVTTTLASYVEDNTENLTELFFAAE